ncbi:urease accessory protein UreD [Geminicoccus flavidas]|uniref:urease accessory protein UreD n=1 Tax=Geminicoccus flavidas TaxID=2506407 RepID=UPI00135B9B47|nr:urease accessory protein UreD [Geminicoccus flavidas]
MRSGLLRIGWDGGRSRRLADLRQEVPLRALFPRETDGADAVVVNTGGGVLGGDRLAVEITLGRDTRALVTSQAAEKVYRSAGPVAELRTTLRVGPGACLTWVPQETILFEGACLHRLLEVDLHPGGRLLAAEMLVFGRVARGELLQNARLREAWEVRIGGRPVWMERFGLTPPCLEILDAPALGGGARALATIVQAGPGAAAALPNARAAMVVQGTARGGVTAVNGLLVGRLLGPDPLAVRRSLAATLCAWRDVLLGESASLPRLWAI